MRMFVAIDCNGEKEYFRRLQGMLPRDGVKNADDFHVTLMFLGEVMPDGVEVIKGALRAVKFLPFSFSLDSIGFFPDEKTPKVVWIGIWPKEDTIMLQQQIEKRLEGFFDKFDKEKRFEPHITLGAVGINESQPALANVRKNLRSITGARFPVSGFIAMLYEKDSGEKSAQLTRKVTIKLL